MNYGRKTKIELLAENKSLQNKIRNLENSSFQNIPQPSESIDDYDFMFSLYKAAPVGIGLVKDRVIITVNKKFTEITGYTTADVTGKNALMLYPNLEEYERVGKQKYEQIAKLGWSRIDSLLRRKDGKIINVLLSFAPIVKNDLSAGITFSILDITLGYHLHEKLKISEAKMNSILSSINDMVFLFDKDERFIFVNTPENDNLLFKKEDFIGKKHSEIMPENVHKLFEKAFRETKTGKLSKFQYNIELQGKTRYYQARLSPMNKKGKFSGCVAVVSEVTQEKENEMRLRENEEKFKTIFNNLGAAIGMVNLEGKFILVNQKFSDITGYSLSELLLKANKELIHPEDQDETIENMKLLAQGKTKSFRSQKRLLHKNGTIIWVDTSVTPKYNIEGEIECFLGVLQDITEAKLMEQDLQKLSASVEQSPVSTVITNLKGQIEYVNPSFCKLTAYTFEEAIGENPRILKSGEQADSYYKNMWEMISRGEIWKGEFHNKKKNGELFWEKATIGPIYNKKGEITHFVALKEDITRQKEIEMELDHYRNDLEALVKDRTVELEESNQELKIKYEELQHYDDLFTGREFRIKDLKEQIGKLKEES